MKNLDTLAATALQKHGNDVEAALPSFVSAVKAAKLIDNLAREHLRQVAMREVGHGNPEAQFFSANFTPVGSEPGHLQIETQSANAGLAPSTRLAKGSIKVKAHPVKQHRRRTHEEKEAAMRAAATSIEAVFEIQINGRAIGKYAIGELAALKRKLYDDAAHGIVLHIIDVRNAIIAEQIEHHCTVQDQLTPVREVIDSETLQDFVRQAELLAPRRVEEGVRHAREAMEHREIAA